MNDFAHAFAVSILVVLPAIGVGIGQGIVNKALIEAIDRQPAAEADLRRLALISTILSETAVLLGFVMAVLLLRQTSSSPYSAFAYLGVSLSLSLPGLVVGIVSARPGKAALEAVARQPLFVSKITQILLLTQSVIQTPSVFGFIIALFLRNQLATISSLSDAIRIAASGIGFGLASVGPLIGLGLLAKTVCTAIGFNREAYNSLRTFTFISQALIEAPVIFGLIVSLVLAVTRPSGEVVIDSAAFLAAALAMGLTTLGTGINSARTAAGAAIQIGRQPELYSVLSKMSLISQTLIDTSTIYGLILSLLIILRR